MFIMRLATFLLRFISQSTAHKVASLFGTGAFLCLKRYREAILSNLTHIHKGGYKRYHYELAKRTFINYVRNFVDFLTLPSLESTELTAMVESKGMENIPYLLQSKKGVILVSAHLGNWELGGPYLASLGYRVYLVAELTPAGQGIFRFYLNYRGRFGANVISLAERNVTFQLRRALSANGLVVIVADRDVGRTGVEVEFFGERVRLPRGPAVLSLRSGAPIVLGALVRTTGHAGGYSAIFSAPLAQKETGVFERDVEELTQRIARRIESMIVAYPDQWYVFQPQWHARRNRIPSPPFPKPSGSTLARGTNARLSRDALTSLSCGLFRPRT